MVAINIVVVESVKLDNPPLNVCIHLVWTLDQPGDFENQSHLLHILLNRKY
jgi:hypothetical protein